MRKDKPGGILPLNLGLPRRQRIEQAIEILQSLLDAATDDWSRRTLELAIEQRRGMLDRADSDDLRLCSKK